MTGSAQRLLIFDDSCRGSGLTPGLSHCWYAGAVLFRAAQRFDGVYAARSWDGALSWLLESSEERPISEVQFWGHGKWGRAMIGCESLSRAALRPSHKFYPKLDQLRTRMAGPEALWWFRTCETFGANAGRSFAEAFTRFFECRAAGHTYIIGAWQSGLHTLSHTQTPYWSENEGVAKGTAAKPSEARWSGPLQPRTVTFMHGSVPAAYLPSA